VSLACACIVGTLIVILIFQQARGKRYDTPLLPVLGFLVLSIASIALYRGLLSGISVVFISRYKMYAGYVLAAGVLLGPVVQAINVQAKMVNASIAASRFWQSFVLLMSTAYFAWSFAANLAQHELIDNDLRGTMERWVEDGDFRRARGFLVPDADRYLFTAIRNGSYTPLVLIPERQIIRDVRAEACPTLDTRAMSADEKPLEFRHKNPNAIGIKLVLHDRELSSGAQVYLCAPENSYRFALPATIASTRENETPGETVFYIPREYVAAGKYSVAIDTPDKHIVLTDIFINKTATR